jgi:hypothetical protein
MRQQAQRVDVAVRLRGDADAEVHVRCRGHVVGALADGADGRSLGKLRAAGDHDGAELEQGDRVAVGSLDRECAPAARHGADEGDQAGGRRDNRSADGRADVDAAVLAARVGVRAEEERAQHGTLDRPRPRRGSRSRDKRREHGRRQKESPHRRPPWCRGEQLRPR